jgi:hypothetical protein
MADGSMVEVLATEYMHFPPPSLREARTVVVYGPDSRDFKLLDSLLIVAAEPVHIERSNGH